MKITFLGTGEACDPCRRNTSLLVEYRGQAHLLDCGFSSPAGFLPRHGQTALQSVWVSHFHGDHFFGLPQLLVFFYQQDRRAPLTIVSGTDSRNTVLAALELAYPGLPAKLPFVLHFETVAENTTRHLNGLTWRTVAVDHSTPAFGLRLQTGTRALYYSGDGSPTGDAVELMRGCDLVVHEAFSRLPTKPTHGSIEECLEIAGRLQPTRMALVHLNRETRRELEHSGRKLPAPATTRLWLPEDGEVLDLSGTAPLP